MVQERIRSGIVGPVKKAKARPKKKRASYHHGSLREALLAAAFEIVENEGADALSVREVARRAGVSPAAPFRHFPDKQALIAAVAIEALRGFLDYAEPEIEKAGADPVDRFRAVGIAYIDYAMLHPARFRAMCDPILAQADTPELNDLRARHNATMRGDVEKSIAEGLTPGDAGAVMLAGQALAYGLARMYVDGVPALPRERAREAAMEAIEVLGIGIDPRRKERKRPH
jgi:AcrR family transcriptional regulator